MKDNKHILFASTFKGGADCPPVPETKGKYLWAVYNSFDIYVADLKGNITYVNELFCQISGFNSEELIGKELKYLKYHDMTSDIYTNLYANVLNNKPWQGKLKNIKKDGTSFTTDSYVMPTFDDSGEMNGAISIQKDITEELNKKREIQLALMRDKSDMFIRSKEGNAEQNQIINELRLRVDKCQKRIVI